MFSISAKHISHRFMIEIQKEKKRGEKEIALSKILS